MSERTSSRTRREEGLVALGGQSETGVEHLSEVTRIFHPRGRVDSEIRNLGTAEMSTPVENDSGMPNESVGASSEWVRWRVHTRLVTPQQLMAGLEAYYDRGSFLVEMQLDWYTIYVRRHDSGQQRTRSDER